MPLEVEIPSLRVLIDFELEEVEWAKVRYEQVESDQCKEDSRNLSSSTLSNKDGQIIRQEGSTSRIPRRRSCTEENIVFYHKKIRVNGCQTMRALTW
jgi:hypothetical protein